MINCPSCGFPISDSLISFKCPFCGKISSMEVAMRGKVQERVQGRIATGGISWMPVLIAFGVGVVFGPTILTATRQGAERMAKMAEERLRKG
jgi:hypothetical protein